MLVYKIPHFIAKKTQQSVFNLHNFESEKFA